MMTVKLNAHPCPLLHFLFIISYSLFLSSCSVSKQISKQAGNILLNDTAIRSGHIGISIYEPATGKYWYNHDAEKYFVPASNTKLFTLYAGMKYLGDSLEGIKYYAINDKETLVVPTGDPTFMHPDFSYQPVPEFLKKQKSIIIQQGQTANPFGKGWAWDDHMDDYMVPRSNFPVYGNLLTVKWIGKDSQAISPRYFNDKIQRQDLDDKGFTLIKTFGENQFTFIKGKSRTTVVPFVADSGAVAGILRSLLNNNNIRQTLNNSILPVNYHTIYSRPVDSLFTPMMHNSDNFFAEQTLVMASIKNGRQLDAEIESLLNNELADIPQRPSWVDGSGLSRYNQFTPKDFIYILNKIKIEFGFERIKNILPTGGTGTLRSYYRPHAGYIFAKTGTLTNHVALSGYLITKRNKILLFSILVNHFQTGATPVRKAIEQFLNAIRSNY